MNAELGIRNAEWASRGEDLKARTKEFGLRVIRLGESLPKTRTADVLGRQLMRSATSVGANYRAACRARSTAEFSAKLGIVEEEADESGYWLEMQVAAGCIRESLAAALILEAHELTAITIASIKTSRRRKPTPR